MFLFVYYSIILDSTDIFTSGKGKASISTNDVETYNKEILSNKIRKLIITNIQLITDKMETEKTRVNLKINKTRLFNKKNFLVVKREELRIEIAILNAANVLIRSH